MTLADAVEKVREKLPPDPLRIVQVSEEWVLTQAKELMRTQEEKRKKKEEAKRKKKEASK